MPYYPQEVIEEVISRTDIVSLVSKYVALKKTGNHYFGLCPFHSEKHASFSVSPDRQTYHCYGCGAHGGVIRFLEEYENMNFVEALQELARDAGVKLPEGEMTSQEQARYDRRTKLYEINKNAAIFYCKQLFSEYGKNGFEYLQSRGLTPDHMKRFGLGYAPAYGDVLYRYLKQKFSYPDDLLAVSGLFRVDKGKFQDLFWNRVMFPIMDRNNRVVAFGGRVMGDGEPKYLNSPETDIFNKSRTLYGVNEARRSRAKEMIICEGYMDVIALHLAGFENSVAALGTAFNSQHATELRKYSKNIIVSFDSDGAGIKAALRAIPVFRQADMSIRILNMDPCKDPDEFLKKFGADAYTERIRQAKNSCFFQIEQLQTQYDLNDTEQRVAYKYAVGELLLDFEDPVKRDAYVEDVTREYGFKPGELEGIVRKVSTSEAYLRKKNNERELERREKERAAMNLPSEAADPSDQEGKGSKNRRKAVQNPDQVKENALIGWLFAEPKLVAAVKPYLMPEDFSDEVHQAAVREIYQAESDTPLNPSVISSRYLDRGEDFADELLNILTISQVNEQLESKEQREGALSEMVRNVLKKSLERRMNEMNLKEFAQKMKAANSLKITL